MLKSDPQGRLQGLRPGTFRGTPRLLTERGRRLRVRCVRASRLRLWAPKDPAQQASITILESDDPAFVTHALAERHIIVDKRPGVVPISPYFYNTVEENRIFLSALGEITGRTG